jgi:hypothetical protein
VDIGQPEREQLSARTAFGGVLWEARASGTGRLTAQYFSMLEEELSEYVSAKFAGRLPDAEIRALIHDVLVRHQAERHVQLTADDPSLDDPFVVIVKRAAFDEVLAVIFPSGPECLNGKETTQERKDDELVARLFGELANAQEVREALRNLHERGQAADFRIVECYLELAELKDDASSAEVAREAGVPVWEVQPALLRFANMLGRPT